MRELTVRELIIETQAQIRRLGGQRRDGLAEPFIILRLNAAQNRLIKSRIHPDPNNPDRFMIDEKYRSDIQRLIVPSKRLPMYTEGEYAFAILPSDFEYLVSDRSVILPDCNDQFETPTQDTVQKIYCFPFNLSSNTPAYTNIVIGGNTYTTNGSPSPKEFYEFIDFIMEKMMDTVPDSQAYWERYDLKYIKNNFLLVGSNTMPDISISIDGAVVNKTVLNIDRVQYKDYNSKGVVNRNIKNDFVHDTIGINYYDKPTPRSPVSYIASNRIFVANSERFLVPRILIDYIRKPRRISLYLNESSELPGSLHEEICSVAAELVLRDVEADNYEQKIRDNVNRLE